MKKILGSFLLTALLAATSNAGFAQEAPATAAIEKPTASDAARQTAKNGAPVSAKGDQREPRPPIIPTQNFASNSQLTGAKLSPDGNAIVLKVELGGLPYLVSFDSATRKPTLKFGIGKKAELEWFRWAGNDKILMSASSAGKFFGDDVRYTRLYLIDLANGELSYIGRKESVVIGDDVIFVADDGSYALVSMQRTPYDYPSVYRFELKDGGKTREVQRSLKGVWNWYADNDGAVRMGTGWYLGKLRVFYRKAAGDDLKLIARIKQGDKEKIWDVSQIVSGSDEGYVLQAGDDGRVGVRRFNYATREVVGTFYENPDWDVDTLLLRRGEPVAVFYTDDRDRAVWFDKESDRNYKLIRKALKEEDVWVTSRAKNGSRMLIWAGGPADPGTLYVFTPDEKRIDKFFELRPRVNFRDLAHPKPVSYEARDGTQIRAYLTLPRGRDAKNLPLILLPHGGPYGVRDKLRYDDDVQLLANRGYAVLQPNFRGSYGYGRDFSKLGSGQIGRKMQDDLDDAMDWAVDQGIADKDRVCVVGGSYGGYAALWAVIRNPERYRCAASWAGVTDWDRMLKYDRRYLSRKGGKKWTARVEGDDDFDLDTVSPYRLGSTLQRPLLLAHGTDDSNVPFDQFKKMRKATSAAKIVPQLLVIKGEGHSFSKPENRKLWYDTLIKFLAQHNPPD